MFPAVFLQKKGAEMTELSVWVGLADRAVQYRSTGLRLDQKSVSEIPEILTWMKRTCNL